MGEYRCVSVSSINKKKYKVVLEGTQTVVMSLYPSEIRRYGLKEGSVLSCSHFEDIMDILYKRGKERALHYLKDADKTTYQMKSKLKEGYYPEDIIERIIEFLHKYGYVDDVRYVENYISYNRKRKSIQRMKEDLMNKGIHREVMNSVFEEYSYENAHDEESLLEDYCRKKITSEMDERAQQKLMMSLMRKGFKYDQIKSVVRKVLEELV